MSEETKPHNTRLIAAKFICDDIELAAKSAGLTAGPFLRQSFEDLLTRHRRELAKGAYPVNYLDGKNWGIVAPERLEADSLEPSYVSLQVSRELQASWQGLLKDFVGVYESNQDFMRTAAAEAVQRTRDRFTDRSGCRIPLLSEVDYRDGTYIPGYVEGAGVLAKAEHQARRDSFFARHPGKTISDFFI